MQFVVVDNALEAAPMAVEIATTVGLELQRATNAEAAWEQVRENAADVVLFSALAPDAETGWALCRRIRSAGFSRCIHLLAIADPGPDNGAVLRPDDVDPDDLLTVPVTAERLHSALTLALRVLRLEREQRVLQRTASETFTQAVHCLERTIGLFDETLGGHCRRVGRLAREMALRCPAMEVSSHTRIEAAGRLHDLGMVGVPPSIRAKRRIERVGDEQQMYQSHAVLGEMIVNDIAALRPLGPLVRTHHEQYNGRGFPDGLAGEAIPIGAQLIAAASIYDNLTQRGGVAPDDVPEHLHRFRGYQLAPDIVDLLLEVHLEQRNHQESRNIVAVDIDQLQEGMLLAQAIRLRTGAVVMPAQTEMARTGIEKLRHCHQLGVIGKTVNVYAYSVRS